MDGRRNTVVAVPLYGQSGGQQRQEPIGAVVATMDTAQLDEILLNREGLGETGEVYLVNQNRTLISELRFIKAAAFRTQVHTLAANECSDSGNEVFAVYPDYRGIPIVGSSYCAGDIGLVLLAEIEEAEIFYPITQLRDAILAAAFVITGVVVVIAVYVSRTISKPITQLKDAADRITKGDYSYNVQVESGDEVGQLSNATRLSSFAMASYTRYGWRLSSGPQMPLFIAYSNFVFSVNVMLDFTPLHDSYPADWKAMFATKAMLLAMHIPSSFAGQKKSQLTRALYGLGKGAAVKEERRFLDELERIGYRHAVA